MLLSPHTIKTLLRLLPPVSFGAMLVLLTYGMWHALFGSPPDYQQGEAVRLMYVHVPAAWLALAIYLAMASASLIYIVWQWPFAELTVQALTPIGTAFAFITLLTGALWGKPIWGTWWVWDPRLTAMLILFCQYLACLLLAKSDEDNQQSRMRLCIWVFVGAINIPIIKFSVNFWHSLHQPASVIKSGGPSIAPEMLKPLLLMALAALFYTLTIAAMRIRTEQMRRKLLRKQLQLGHRVSK